MTQFHLFAHIRRCGLDHFEAVVTAVPSGDYTHALISRRRSEVQGKASIAETARDALVAEVRAEIVERGDSIVRETVE
jgi:hypothetical protein